MLADRQVALIGGGHIAEIIIHRLTRGKVLSGDRIIVSDPAEIRIEAGGALLHRLDIGTTWRTELVLSGGRPSVELHFDASGLGSMAARSVAFTRGSAVVRLIISAYGRIRRE